MLKRCVVCDTNFETRCSANTCSQKCKTARHVWRTTKNKNKMLSDPKVRERYYAKERERKHRIRQDPVRRDILNAKNREWTLLNSDKKRQIDRNRWARQRAALRLIKELETKGLGALL